jgi:phosphohistidine swiveling domain-containing protein
VSDIIWLADESAQLRASVGGKGANLGRLFSAGLAVPPAFVVSTSAYRAVIADAGLTAAIDATIAALDYSDSAALEQKTAALREHIENCSLPSMLTAQVNAAYAKLGPSAVYVAVRSSGTAEDTASASFAGLHDTFLDVRGENELHAALRRCWASLWTARATAYRNTMGFAHEQAEIAVVVQVMVESEVAGVMFTANPLTGATDESVINASWGLGEAVVSGAVTPDEFILSHATLALRRQNLGNKDREIVRDPNASSGTIMRDIAPGRRQVAALEPAQLHQLSALGQRVMRHYGGMPQDIEWAYAAGQFYLLQSRDVTATQFAWDEDVEGWQSLADDDNHVWTRAFADEWWTGAVTPLFYSVRAQGQTACHIQALSAMGLETEAGMRIFKYHNAEVYWNATLEAREAPQFIPRFLRSAAALGRVPPAWWATTIAAPFSWLAYLKLYARLTWSDRSMGPGRWIDAVYSDMNSRTAEADGLDDAALGALDDTTLQRYLESRIDFFVAFNRRQWAGFFIFAPGLLLLLGDLIGRWYRGTNSHAFADLLTGLPRQTVTLMENETLWHLAQMIRNSATLTDLFERHPGAAFFDATREHPQAAEFNAAYATVLADHGHRGQADRDFWFPRRIENPAGDYNAFKAILSSSSTTSPAAAEESTRVLREGSIMEVLDNLRSQRAGLFKVKLFKFVLDQVYRFLQVRDDERHYIDRITWSKKRALLEINRRLLERQVLRSADDYFFLSKDELYELLAGTHDERRTQAKIAGRRHNFERFDRKLVIPPAFLQNGAALDLDLPRDPYEVSDGALHGLGTSRGTVSGPACVVRSLDEIGRVQAGDILVCQATDPGWTPVFLVIGGLVLETGGMLAHGSCLSREYGLPAVQVRNAMNLIEDGALISVDGAKGTVTFAAPATATLAQ